MQIHLHPFCLNYHPSLYQAEAVTNGLLIPIRFFIVFGSFAFSYWLNGMQWCLFAKDIWTVIIPYCVGEAYTTSITLPKDTVSFSIVGIIPVPIPRILGFVWFVGVFCIVCNILCLSSVSLNHTPELLPC